METAPVEQTCFLEVFEQSQQLKGSCTTARSFLPVWRCYCFWDLSLSLPILLQHLQAYRAVCHSFMKQKGLGTCQHQDCKAKSTKITRSLLRCTECRSMHQHTVEDSIA
eukprot:5875569-Amphidinium_carterae.1